MAGNSNSKQSQISHTPVLDEKYSGIPSRLLDKANSAKELLLSNQTVTVTPRKQDQDLPVIPKGYPREKFKRAIAALQASIGRDNVVLNVEPLDDGWYMEHPTTHDAFYLTDQDDLVSCATAFPSSVEEVQTVVRWANEYLMPIYPISMGRNLGYGGAAPRVRGSVVVDLGKRMNKILDINPDTSSCLVEPGVSFYALYEEIQRRGHKDMWIDVPDLGGGSVLGNTIDRGQGYTPAGDHFSSHCGMEVVTPTGNVLRTGMGGLPGNNTWQVFPYGYGPYPDGIFSQSNFGIVTKIGMQLMPNPGGSQGFMVTFKEDEDMFNAIDMIRPLRVRNILENVAQLKHVIQEVALLGKPRSYYWDKPTPMPIEEVRKVAAKLPCGDCTWIYYGTIYGPPQLRKAKENLIRDKFTSLPGCRWIERDFLPKDHYFFSRENISSGKPDMEELTWLNWSPNGAHVFFSPVCPPSSNAARTIFEITKKRHKEFNLDNFPTCCIGKREILLIVNMVYDRGDPVSRSNAYSCMRAMVDDAAKEGYGEYRTHLLLADQVAGTYSWNNHAQMRFNEQLKDSLDPNGILAPGRSGIWPKRYRDNGWKLNTLGPSSEGNEVLYEGRAKTTGSHL